MSEKRKPARRMSEIPPQVLAALNRGETETANLVEWLATDQRQLARHVFGAAGIGKHLDAVLAAVATVPKPTAMQQTRIIGLALARVVEVKESPRSAYQRLLRHPSDVVRNWVGFIVGGQDGLGLAEKLNAIQSLAADKHFGVRETAWLAVRPAVEQELEAAIDLLSTWPDHEHEGIRRFASEVTRPCGVWCNHLVRLKSEPQLALPILEPLKSDAAKYVRDSVGNWLNDASKSQPKWVVSLCRRWQRESKTPETAYIVNKALRTLRRIDQ
ncbi:MAG: DNA alkylation repair protein [Planctomycetaceae bacterium]|nr:DNA alkylation repair protein [Planctomycetaceae bacterium]